MGRKPLTKEEKQRKDATRVLGLGVVAGSMRLSTNRRNLRVRQSSLTPNPENQRSDATKVLGLGAVAKNMLKGTNDRNKKGRMHQEITNKQATEILIRQLIHQHCRCYVTGLPLAVYGTGVGSPWDSYRYSPDRLDNNRG